ncbi:MAG TPA: hypothetical protein VKR52_17720 [Terracidiphilus sp.]|nr:hypothetical protein [Terracidiphilus sp.]
MEDEKFIPSIQSALSARIQADELKRKKEVRENEVREFQSPRDWMRLKTWLKQAVSSINQGLPSEALSYEEDAKDRIFVRCAVGQRKRELKVEFVSLLGGSVTVSEKDRSVLHLESIVLENKLQWVNPSEDGARRYDAEGIGMKIVSLVAEP